MPLDTINDGQDGLKNQEVNPLDTAEVERIEKIGEQIVLDRVNEIREGIESALNNEDILSTQKGNLIGYIESQSKQIGDILNEGGTQEYTQKLSEFQTYLNTTRDQLLSTLTPEEKEQREQPRSTGTGATNTDAYTANRNKRRKNITRLF